MKREIFRKKCEELGKNYVTIVALGDSNTGVNHWTLGGLNWVGYLECNVAEICKKGYTIINSSSSGNDLTQITHMERSIFRFNPDIVIVSLGLNDSRFGKPEQFSEDYTKLLRMLKERNILVLTRTPNPVLNMIDGKELLGDIEVNGEIYKYDVSGYSKKIVEVSEKENIACVDHYSLWRKSLDTIYHGEMNMLMSNFLHPNTNGHRRFYHELAPFFGLRQDFQFEYSRILNVCQ